MDVYHNLYKEVSRLLDEKRLAEAKIFLEQAAIDSLNLLGLLYGQELDNIDLGIKCLEVACDIDKGNYSVRNNLAHLLNDAERFDEASTVIRHAVHLSGNKSYESIRNAAIIFNNNGQISDAIEQYRNAILLNENDDIHYNLASCLLSNSEYKEGWEHYEYRLLAFDKTIEFEKRFSQPRWKGEDLSGKTVIVYNEQGIGDLINFSRYIPELYDRGAKSIILESQESIASLMEDNFPNIEVVRRGDDNYPPSPRGDIAISVCSLPYYLGYDSLNKISGKPYLKVKEDNPPECLKKIKKIRVGVAWAGNANHGHDYMRSCPAKWFTLLNDIPEIQLFSLQKLMQHQRLWKKRLINIHDGYEDISMINLSSFLTSFKNTAICINHLDLIITVDSAVAHLAGAMGKPVWMMIPTICDWRWLRTPCHDTVWYDSMRIYRQHSLYDWHSVFNQIRDDLMILKQNYSQI